MKNLGLCQPKDRSEMMAPCPITPEEFDSTASVSQDGEAADDLHSNAQALVKGSFSGETKATDFTLDNGVNKHFNGTNGLCNGFINAHQITTERKLPAIKLQTSKVIDPAISYPSLSLNISSPIDEKTNESTFPSLNTIPKSLSPRGSSSKSTKRPSLECLVARLHSRKDDSKTPGIEKYNDNSIDSPNSSVGQKEEENHFKTKLDLTPPGQLSKNCLSVLNGPSDLDTTAQKEPLKVSEGKKSQLSSAMPETGNCETTVIDSAEGKSENLCNHIDSCSNSAQENISGETEEVKCKNCVNCSCSKDNCYQKSLSPVIKAKTINMTCKSNARVTSNDINLSMKNSNQGNFSSKNVDIINQRQCGTSESKYVKSQFFKHSDPDKKDFDHAEINSEIKDSLHLSSSLGSSRTKLDGIKCLVENISEKKYEKSNSNVSPIRSKEKCDEALKVKESTVNPFKENFQSQHDPYEKSSQVKEEVNKVSCEDFLKGFKENEIVPECSSHNKCVSEKIPVKVLDESSKGSAKDSFINRQRYDGISKETCPDSSKEESDSLSDEICETTAKEVEQSCQDLPREPCSDLSEESHKDSHEKIYKSSIKETCRNVLVKPYKTLPEKMSTTSLVKTKNTLSVETFTSLPEAPSRILHEQSCTPLCENSSNTCRTLCNTLLENKCVTMPEDLCPPSDKESLDPLNLCKTLCASLPKELCASFPKKSSENLPEDSCRASNKIPCDILNKSCKHKTSDCGQILSENSLETLPEKACAALLKDPCAPLSKESNVPLQHEQCAVLSEEPCKPLLEIPCTSLSKEASVLLQKESLQKKLCAALTEKLCTPLQEVVCVPLLEETCKPSEESCASLPKELSEPLPKECCVPPQEEPSPPLQEKLCAPLKGESCFPLKEQCAPLQEDSCAPLPKEEYGLQQEELCAPLQEKSCKPLCKESKASTLGPKKTCAPLQEEPCTLVQEELCEPIPKEPCAPLCKESWAPSQKEPCKSLIDDSCTLLPEAPLQDKPCAPLQKQPCKALLKQSCSLLGDSSPILQEKSSDSLPVKVSSSLQKDQCASLQEELSASIPRETSSTPLLKGPSAPLHKESCASLQKEPCESLVEAPFSSLPKETLAPLLKEQCAHSQEEPMTPMQKKLCVPLPQKPFAPLLEESLPCKLFTTLQGESCTPLQKEQCSLLHKEPCVPLQEEQCAPLQERLCSPVLNKTCTTLQKEQCSPLTEKMCTSLHKVLEKSCAPLQKNLCTFSNDSFASLPRNSGVPLLAASCTPLQEKTCEMLFGSTFDNLNREKCSQESLIESFCSSVPEKLSENLPEQPFKTSEELSEVLPEGPSKTLDEKSSRVLPEEAYSELHQETYLPLKLKPYNALSEELSETSNEQVPKTLQEETCTASKLAENCLKDLYKKLPEVATEPDQGTCSEKLPKESDKSGHVSTEKMSTSCSPTPIFSNTPSDASQYEMMIKISAAVTALSSSASKDNVSDDTNESGKELDTESVSKRRRLSSSLSKTQGTDMNSSSALKSLEMLQDGNSEGKTDISQEAFELSTEKDCPESKVCSKISINSSHSLSDEQNVAIKTNNCLSNTETEALITFQNVNDINVVLPDQNEDNKRNFKEQSAEIVKDHQSLNNEKDKTDSFSSNKGISNPSENLAVKSSESLVVRENPLLCEKRKEESALNENLISKQILTFAQSSFPEDLETVKPPPNMYCHIKDLLNKQNSENISCSTNLSEKCEPQCSTSTVQTDIKVNVPKTEVNSELIFFPLVSDKFNKKYLDLVLNKECSYHCSQLIKQQICLRSTKSESLQHVRDHEKDLSVILECNSQTFLSVSDNEIEMKLKEKEEEQLSFIPNCDIKKGIEMKGIKEQQSLMSSDCSTKEEREEKRLPLISTSDYEKEKIILEQPASTSECEAKKDIKIDDTTEEKPVLSLDCSSENNIKMEGGREKQPPALALNYNHENENTEKAVLCCDSNQEENINIKEQQLSSIPNCDSNKEISAEEKVVQPVISLIREKEVRVKNIKEQPAFSPICNDEEAIRVEDKREEQPAFSPVGNNEKVISVEEKEQPVFSPDCIMEKELQIEEKEKEQPSMNTICGFEEDIKVEECNKESPALGPDCEKEKSIRESNEEQLASSPSSVKEMEIGIKKNNVEESTLSLHCGITTKTSEENKEKELVLNPHTYDKKEIKDRESEEEQQPSLSHSLINKKEVVVEDKDEKHALNYDGGIVKEIINDKELPTMCSNRDNNKSMIVEASKEEQPAVSPVCNTETIQEENREEQPAMSMNSNNEKGVRIEDIQEEQPALNFDSEREIEVDENKGLQTQSSSPDFVDGREIRIEESQENNSVLSPDCVDEKVTLGESKEQSALSPDCDELETLPNLFPREETKKDLNVVDTELIKVSSDVHVDLEKKSYINENSIQYEKDDVTIKAGMEKAVSGCNLKGESLGKNEDNRLCVTFSEELSKSSETIEEFEVENFSASTCKEELQGCSFTEFLKKDIDLVAGQCVLCKSFFEDLSSHASLVHTCVSYIPVYQTQSFFHYMRERIGDVSHSYSDATYGNPEYICKCCSFLFKTMDAVRLHLNIHNDIYKIQSSSENCSCRKKCFSYNKHKWRSLLLQSKSTCSFCHCLFACENGLINHLKVVHFFQQSCLQCGVEVDLKNENVLEHHNSHSCEQNLSVHLFSDDDSKPKRDQTHFSWSALDNHLNYMDGKVFRLKALKDLGDTRQDRSALDLPIQVDPSYATLPEGVSISPAPAMSKYLRSKLHLKLTGSVIDHYASEGFDMPIQMMLQKKFSGKNKKNKISKNTRMSLPVYLNLQNLRMKKKYLAVGYMDDDSNLTPRRMYARRAKTKVLKNNSGMEQEVKEEEELLKPSRTRSGMRSQDPLEEEQDDSTPSTPTNEITGEWVNYHTYVCCSCGAVFLGLAEIMDHKWEAHPGVWCAHTMIQGQERVPKMFYEQYLPAPSRSFGPTPSSSGSKLMKRKAAKENATCSQCKTTFENKESFHFHIIDCGGLNKIITSKNKKSKKGPRFKRRKGQGIPSRRYANNSLAPTPHKHSNERGSGMSTPSKESLQHALPAPSLASTAVGASNAVKRRLQMAVGSIENSELKNKLEAIISGKPRRGGGSVGASSSRRNLRTRLKKLHKRTRVSRSSESGSTEAKEERRKKEEVKQQKGKGSKKPELQRGSEAKNGERMKKKARAGETVKLKAKGPKIVKQSFKKSEEDSKLELKPKKEPVNNALNKIRNKFKRAKSDLKSPKKAVSKPDFVKANLERLKSVLEPKKTLKRAKGDKPVATANPFKRKLPPPPVEGMGEPAPPTLKRKPLPLPHQVSEAPAPVRLKRKAAPTKPLSDSLISDRNSSDSSDSEVTSNFGRKRVQIRAGLRKRKLMGARYALRPSVNITKGDEDAKDSEEEQVVVRPLRSATSRKYNIGDDDATEEVDPADPAPLPTVEGEAPPGDTQRPKPKPLSRRSSTQSSAPILESPEAKESPPNESPPKESTPPKPPTEKPSKPNRRKSFPSFKSPNSKVNRFYYLAQKNFSRLKWSCQNTDSESSSGFEGFCASPKRRRNSNPSELVHSTPKPNENDLVPKVEKEHPAVPISKKKSVSKEENGLVKSKRKYIKKSLKPRKRKVPVTPRLVLSDSESVSDIPVSERMEKSRKVFSSSMVKGGAKRPGKAPVANSGSEAQGDVGSIAGPEKTKGKRKKEAKGPCPKKKRVKVPPPEQVVTNEPEGELVKVPSVDETLDGSAIIKSKLKPKRKYTFKKRSLNDSPEDVTSGRPKHKKILKEVRVLSYRSLNTKDASLPAPDKTEEKPPTATTRRPYRKRIRDHLDENSPAIGKPLPKYKKAKEPRKSPDPILCSDCGLSFDSALSREDHRQDCRNIAFEMSLMAEDHLYECPHCQLTFALKGTQRKHIVSCRLNRTRKFANRRRRRTTSISLRGSIDEGKPMSSPPLTPESSFSPGPDPSQVLLLEEPEKTLKTEPEMDLIASRLLDQCQGQSGVKEICSLLIEFQLCTNDLRTLLTTSSSTPEAITSFQFQTGQTFSQASVTPTSNYQTLQVLLNLPVCHGLSATFQGTLKTLIKDSVSPGPTRDVTIDLPRADLLKAVSSVEELLKEIADLDSFLKKHQMLLTMKQTFQAGTGS